MQLDTSPLAGTAHARLGILVRQFLRAMERQRRYDAELEAALERLARRGVIRKIIQENGR
jgi:hypothetical protein